jgi:hypothetical protein
MPLSVLPTIITLYLLGYNLLFYGIISAIISCFIDHNLAHWLCHNNVYSKNHIMYLVNRLYFDIHYYHHKDPSNLQLGALIPWTDYLFGTFPKINNLLNP